MKIKYYLTLYVHVLAFYIKSAMEYRLNFLLKIFYGPAYTFTLFLLLAIAYSHTESLVGWSKQEAFLQFSVFHSMYTICFIGFIESIKYYLWEGFRTGDFDTIMLKPANTQFLATFLRPDVNLLPQLLFLLGMSVRQLVVLQVALFSWNFLFFLAGMALAFLIIYFFISSVMTLGIYVTKAAQMYEFFDKITDNAQYPTPLFPFTFQAIFFTILPVAFFSYVPTSILLGKNSPIWLIYSVIVAAIFFGINRWCWKQALKHYSSASS